MYQQINEQFVASTRQFADTAAQINRLALQNAEAVIGLQLSAMNDRLNANFAFWNEASQVRDAEGLKALWPKGVQVARENMERAVSTTQDVVARTLKAQESIGQIAKAQAETTARATQDNVAAAARDVQAKVDQAAQAVNKANNK